MSLRRFVRAALLSVVVAVVTAVGVSTASADTVWTRSSPAPTVPVVVVSQDTVWT